MQAAARAFVGMRDFQSFAQADDDAPRSDRQAPPSTRVLINRLEIVEAGDLVLIGIEGSHFLWKMVRRIVGVLVGIGRGALAEQAAAQFLLETSDVPARLTAPASGLFLERVYYGDDMRASRRSHAVGASQTEYLKCLTAPPALNPAADAARTARRVVTRGAGATRLALR